MHDALQVEKAAVRRSAGASSRDACVSHSPYLRVNGSNRTPSLLDPLGALEKCSPQQIRTMYGGVRRVRVRIRVREYARERGRAYVRTMTRPPPHTC